MLLRNDEHLIGRNLQPVCDQVHRHLGVGRKHFVEHGRQRSHVIHNDDRDTHIDRQIA